MKNKRILKIVLLIVIIVLHILVYDAFISFCRDKSPLIRVRKTYENYKVDYGLLTKTYIDCNNESKTISRFSDRKINFYYCEK